MSKSKHGKKANKGSRARHKGKGSGSPGILRSWEDFNEEAMSEFLYEIECQAEEELEALEESLRCSN
jgi:hypothetical protein